MSEDDPRPDDPRPDDDRPQPRQQPRQQDGGARAVDEAKKHFNACLSAYKGLSLTSQIYIAGLAVVVFFGLFFNIVSIEYPEAYEKFIGGKRTGNGRSLAGAGNSGLVAYLAAIAGIGICIWNVRATVKQPWAIYALAGCAAGVVLFMFVATQGVSSGFSGGEKFGFSVSRSLLGFWIPMIGALAATAVSVKAIIDEKKIAAPPTRRSGPPPPPPA